MFFPIAIFALIAAGAASAVAFVRVCLDDMRDERETRARLLR